MALLRFKRYHHAAVDRVHARYPVGVYDDVRHFFFAYDLGSTPIATGATDQIPRDADYERDLQTFHDLLALSSTT